MTFEPRAIDGLTKQTAGFDFLVGAWNVSHHRLRNPLTGSDEWYDTAGPAWSTTMHNGAISLDEMWFPELGIAGSSIRVYTSHDQHWAIHWVDSSTGHLQSPVRGTWSADGSRFVGEGPDVCDGRDILARFRWHSITAECATWEQEFSADRGETWEANWIMHWTRA